MQEHLQGYKIAICRGKTRKSRIIAVNDQNRGKSREMAKIAVYRGKLQKLRFCTHRDKFLPLGHGLIVSLGSGESSVRPVEHDSAEIR
ncbi:MAG: hypothetical protein GY820_48435 [Gammaproteobacteria bacterium]|nr:hypothetical protein [Gammaproteobacteria bacterium]